MPLTREAIKHAPVSSETWRPQRTQAGGLWFDPLKVKPMGNHILVVLDGERPASPRLVIPDIARNQEIGTRTGTVVAVGPGKWHEKPGETWENTGQYFIPTTLKPGDRVVIGHYSDWESWSCDYEGRGPNVVLCQEADVRVVENVSIEEMAACL